MNIDKWLGSLRHKKALAEFSDLAGWRNYYFDLMLFLSLILLPIALIASLPTYIAGRNLGVIAFEIGAFLLLLILFSMRDSSLRGIIFLFFGYLMVITFFISLGPFYARPGWLVLCSVTAALLFGVQAAISATVINAGLLIVLYVFIGPNLQSWAPVYMEPESKWIIFIVSLSVISLVASLPVSLLLKRLNTSFSHKRDLRNKLSHESELLQTTNISLQNQIAERLQAEEVLRKVKDFNETLVQASPAFFVAISPEGKTIMMNEAMLQALGYPLDEVVGKDYLTTFVPESDREMLSEVFQDLAQAKKPTINENFILTRDGKQLRVEWHGRFVFKENDELDFFFGVGIDITSRKQAETELRKSDDRYRTLVENASDIVFRTDNTGHFTFGNPAALGITGYREEELRGKHYRKLIRPDKLDETIKLLVGQLTNRVSNTYYEFPIITKDGHEKWLGQNTQLIVEDGNVVGFQAVARDITDRKQAEEALSLSQLRLRLFIDANSDLLFLKDSDLKYQMVNSANAALFGLEEAKILGKTDDDLMPVQAARACRESDLQALRQKRSITAIELVGDKVYETHKFPVIIEGNAVGVAGIIRDITARKALEAQLNQAQKMESIGTLAGGIAHDFNNLLMGILGNASLILMNLDKSHPVFDRLKNIEDYVQRGSNLTKQLLGFARSGKYETKPTNLAEFIRESSELFGRTKKEIRIYRNAQEDLWTVEVDRGQMEQVLLNLYVNAWQAMPGGGDLYLSAQNVSLDEVDVSPYPYDINPGKYVRVTVTDTGIGMDEATMARIFEPFFTTKEKGRGTGLGLASAYGIIKNHGGFIHVESKEGHGTSFMIYLPASNKIVENDHKAEDELQKGQETVLLIDDEEMILDVGAKMLEQLGYQVISATGGKKGLQAYEQNRDRIDLVILDMIMPEFSGRESFDTMIRVNPSVKVLLSSGYSLDSQAKEIMQRGCKGFIQKPFTMTELSKKIRDILDKQ